MFRITVLAWLLELGAAVVLAIAGVTIWALPLNTPVIGRPPVGLGWGCIILAALTAVLSTANFLGWELQSPVRPKERVKKRVETYRPHPPAPLVPVPVAPQTAASPEPEKRTLIDVTSQALVELAKTPNLTGAQLGGLLTPHKGKWLTVGGMVEDVDDTYSAFHILKLSNVNGDALISAQAYFYRNKERVEALPIGTNVRLQGKFKNATKYGQIFLDDCELIG